MDNSEAPKARRPLPTPGATQRPSTPAMSTSPVPASTFYQKAPPLPSRPKNHGSSHTAYVAPAQDPPRYSASPSGFREPELVTEEPTEDDDMVPDLIPQDHTWDSNMLSYANNNWGTGEADWNHQPSGWENTTASNWTSGNTNSSGGTGFDAMDYLGTSSNRADIDSFIDGRSHDEETLWWNPEVRDRNRRPGPGFLPPVLAEELHDPNHSIFSVNITGTPPPSSKDQAAPGSSSSSSTNDPPPSENEARLAVPHPNAYFCSKDYGWVLLSWKSSSVAPPHAASYQQSPTHPFPDQNRRKHTENCIPDTDQPFGTSNKTHHFHKYERAIDSHKLTPPLRLDDWQSLEDTKQRRRAGAYMDSDLDIRSINPNDVDSLETDEGSADAEGKLMDLYVCCQCSFYCVASGVIPCVIPKKHIDELLRDKRSHPGLNKSPEQTAVLAMETILTAVENRLYKGNARSIKVSSSGFQTKVGWNPNIKKIFESLGFVEDVVNQEINLRPPTVELNTASGKQSRRKMLRAWLEISAWLVDFKRVYASHFKEWKEFKLWVQLDSSREVYQRKVGAHPDQIPRGELTGATLDAVRPLEVSWRELGLTVTTYSCDLLAFAYLSQCRCDPAGTPKYFSHLTSIVNALLESGSCPPQLQELIATEQSRDRFTLEDIPRAATTLGFGHDNVLHVDYDDDIPDDFVENAWKDCVKRSWRDLDHGSETHRYANEALRVLAESRNSVVLKAAWGNGKNKYMNPDRAYNTLEVPKETEDSMLITVYNMRLDETPRQLEKMQEALTVIAEVRDSDRLRQFVATGMDPGDIVTPTRPDLPRGLNQLGNTCYLNSLLQYFYTIKDLREAVLPMSKLDLKALADEKLSDEDLRKHRVGGRLVTRREIVRSRKFINQLADLFYNLEYCDTAAVTPTLELAKLALVTSRDEEEDEIDKGTDSSNDTDATLVEDGPSRSTLDTSFSQSPGKTVLGKRPRDLDRHRSEMEVDSPLSQSPKEKDGFVMVSTRKDRNSLEAGSSNPEASSSKTQLADRDGDVNMATPVKPPPPPRKRTEVSDSTMMFGKQHDVAECMDNCMFQIETALLKFENVDESTDKTSVVKRLFYGKIRQRLTGAEVQQARFSIHEKEDLFSHLPVNVTNDGVDIYDGLSGYFDDVVEYEGRKARMEVTLVDLPPLLQIQLQRVQFNRDTLQPYKSQAYVKFGENLYMDRFMDSADPAKKAKSKAIQAELTTCRERARLLVEGKDSPFTSSLEHTRKFLEASSLPGVDDELLKELDAEQHLLREEIDRLRARADTLKDQLENIWHDSTQVEYELTSVFVHRGSSPSWGHYFFYSRHLPGSPDSWFKYNDSDVSVVPKDEVLADTTGSTANPYLLVFARKGTHVVDTVKRFNASILESA